MIKLFKMLGLKEPKISPCFSSVWLGRFGFFSRMQLCYLVGVVALLIGVTSGAKSDVWEDERFAELLEHR